MSFSFLRTSLVVLLLTTVLISCYDHAPLASQRLRLKKSVEHFGGEATLTTEFTYDASGRPLKQQSYSYPASPTSDNFYSFNYDAQNRVSFTTGRYHFPFYVPFEEPQPNGYHGNYEYDEAGRVKKINFLFTYSNSPTVKLFRVWTFEYNAMNQVINLIQNDFNFVPGASVDYEKRFTYQNGNIVQMDQLIYAAGTKDITNRTRVLVTYDDKPNPYYGMSGLNVPTLLMFSRNHYTSYTIQQVSNDGSVVEFESKSIHETTYNERGIITKWRGNAGSFGPTTITYEYESY